MIRAALLVLLSVAVSLVVGRLWITVKERVGGACGAWLKRSPTSRFSPDSQAMSAGCRSPPQAIPLRRARSSDFTVCRAE
jgi:hypothetical protein